MNVLIIDDSPEKIERIKKSILGMVPDAKFIYAFSYWGAKFELDEAKDTFDFIVCDMQFPIKENDRIEREAGIQMLSLMTRMKLKATIVVASSSDTVGELLEEKGYGHIPAIKASSMYDLTSQFRPHLTSFIKEEPKIPSVSIRDYVKPPRRGPAPKVKTDEDHARIRKAELKREIKARKKALPNAVTSLDRSNEEVKISELQEEYKNL